ncbi:hypothetical protein OAL24_01673 [Oenococcus sicerae]|nr:hypothetical protein OAL24_01673 [Oenococcus sicerae]
MTTIASYEEIKKNYNQLVSEKYQLPVILKNDGQILVLDSDPIKITMDLQNGQVQSIQIHSSKDGDHAWDEVFEGFEQGMGWSSMNFYNAYRSAVTEHQTTVGKAHGIQAIHESPTANDLTVTISRI